RCGDGGSAAGPRGRVFASESRHKRPVRVLVLRAPLHADEASGSRAVPPGPNAGEGGGISHDVSRRLVHSSSGRHLDRVLGCPPSCAQRGIVFGGSSTFRFNTSGPFSLLEFLATIVDIVSLAVVTLALSSVVWTYWSISKG